MPGIEYRSLRKNPACGPPAASVTFAWNRAMDIRRLKTFLAVCETGSISRAAERLHLSQPALTRRIQELEHEYDAVLFERAKSGMTLTDEGLLIQAHARQILNLENALRRELESSGDGLAGLVRIGCVETNAARVLARWLTQWRRLHPKAQVEIHSADSDDLKAHLDAGTLDCAILLAPVEAAKYRSVVLREKETWGIVVHRDHPLAGKSAVTTDMLEGFPLMLPHRHILRDAFEEWFGEAAPRMKAAAYVNLSSVPFVTLENDPETVMLVVKGAFDMRPPQHLAYLPLTPARTSEQILVRRRNASLSRSAEAFWRFAQEAVESDALT